MDQQMIFSVSEANNFIKALLDGVPQLQEIYVRGEISNYKLYPSGHHYFTLKDAEGAMRCVMFKGAATHLPPCPFYHRAEEYNQTANRRKFRSCAQIRVPKILL